MCSTYFITMKLYAPTTHTLSSLDIGLLNQIIIYKSYIISRSTIIDYLKKNYRMFYKRMSQKLFTLRHKRTCSSMCKYTRRLNIILTTAILLYSHFSHLISCPINLHLINNVDTLMAIVFDVYEIK